MQKTDLIANVISFILSNFSASMFLLAVIFIAFHRYVLRRAIPVEEIVYRWMALFAVGFTGLYTAFFHAFYPEITALNIGWAPSPFQFEVAMADLGFGLLALLSFKASYPFRLAAVIGNTIWLWGDAIGHIYQMVIHQNFAPGNAGSWFWMDVINPLILIICMIKLKPSRLNRR